VVARAVDVHGSSTTRPVRELLDDARASEYVDAAAARALAQQARVLARSLSDGEGEAEGMYRLASIAYNTGDLKDALAIALRSQELAQGCNSARIEVYALNLLSLVHYDAGNLSAALATALAALDLYRLTGDDEDEGNILNTVAIAHFALGDMDRALVTYEAALHANRGRGRQQSDTLILSNLSQVRFRRGEFLLAASLAEQALELSEEHAPEYVPFVLVRLAEAYSGLGVFDRATELLNAAEDKDALGADSLRAQVRYSLGVGRAAVLVSEGRLEAAVDRYLEALAVADEASMLESQLSAHGELAALYKRLGRPEEALQHQEQRFQKYEELFARGTDLRIKTMQIEYDIESARHQAEILRLRTGELEALVRGRTQELESYQLEAFERLAVLAEFRDTDTGEHTVRVGDMAAAIAEQIGKDAEFVQHLRMAGRLHDIGKVAVPDAILLKPGPLTDDEFAVMKTHTTIGAEILSGSLSPLIQLAEEVALNHHERWDGSGYPNGLQREDIPLSGRIVSIADVFDALCSVRTYKRAWPRAEAAQYILDGRGMQFDPRLVDAFLVVVVRMHPELAELRR
jgi:putative nucleotidyltransferase with HDIG domain